MAGEGLENQESKFARSVVRWIAVGVPVTLVFFTLAMWLVLDVSFQKAFAIAVWPSILTGTFGGGFVGVVRGGG